MIDLKSHVNVSITLYVLLTRFTDTSAGRVSIFPYDVDNYIINLNLASEIMKSIFLCWKTSRKTFCGDFRKLFQIPRNASIKDLAKYTGVHDNKLEYYMLIPKIWLDEFIRTVKPMTFDGVLSVMNLNLLIESRLQYEYLNRSLSVDRIVERSKRILSSNNPVLLGVAWTKELLVDKFGSSDHRYGFFLLEPFIIKDAHPDLFKNIWYQSDGNDIFRALMIAKFLIYNALDRPQLKRGRKRKADNVDSHDDDIIRGFIESGKIQEYTLSEAIKFLEPQMKGYTPIDYNLINANFQ
jgi:hypothetical protein